jgi:hypothetical protein
MSGFVTSQLIANGRGKGSDSLVSSANSEDYFVVQLRPNAESGV